MKKTKGYYRVKFDDQRKVHALTTHHAPIEDYELDSMWSAVNVNQKDMPPFMNHIKIMM